MKTNRPFHQWSHKNRRAEHHVVLPDGCRDVLIIHRPDASPEILLTDFDFRPRKVLIHPNTKMIGFRLRPGALPCRDALEAILTNHAQTGSILAVSCGQPNDLEYVIAALTAPEATTRDVARDAGVSPRTLQRQFQAKGLPPPDFWRLLARARRAASMLAGPEPLVEIAYACGYSDQAHMSRELIRWFGASPMQLRTSHLILDRLAQPALGNWTGEQISTR